MDVEKGDGINGTIYYKTNDTNNNCHNNQSDSKTLLTNLSDINTTDENKSFSCNIIHRNEITTQSQLQQPSTKLMCIANSNEQNTLTDTIAEIQPTKSTDITENKNYLKYSTTGTTAQQINNITNTTTPKTVVISQTFYNNEYNDIKQQQNVSSKIENFVQRSKWFGTILISCLLAVSIAITICIKMGWDYTIPAIIVGIITIIASSGLWYWLYIAAITAPRDIK